MVKMAVDIILALGHKVLVGAKQKFDLLADIEVLLSISCFLLLLDVTYNLTRERYFHL